MTGEVVGSEHLKYAYEDDLDFRATYGSWKNGLHGMEVPSCTIYYIVQDGFLFCGKQPSVFLKEPLGHQLYMKILLEVLVDIWEVQNPQTVGRTPLLPGMAKDMAWYVDTCHIRQVYRGKHPNITNHYQYEINHGNT